jgi:hypothetical protein
MVAFVLLAGAAHALLRVEADESSSGRPSLTLPRLLMPHLLPRGEALTVRNAVPRRALMAALLPAICCPDSAEASYALSKAAQDTLQQRQQQGTWKPGSDREILAEIQNDISIKRPQYNAKKAKKKQPFTCAGDRSVVQPQFENICEVYGLSKADQATKRNEYYDYYDVDEGKGYYGKPPPAGSGSGGPIRLPPAQSASEGARRNLNR